MIEIALLQNDSEMIRYSWSEISGSIRRQEHRVHRFSAQNVEHFFSSIDGYDAIILAQNALKDDVLSEAFKQHANWISKTKNQPEYILATKVPRFQTKAFQLVKIH